MAWTRPYLPSLSGRGRSAQRTPVERLPRDRIQRFQEVLVAQGHDVGKVDGLAGFKTRAAIGVTEKRLGLPLTCYPSQRLVDAVMKEASAAKP